MSDEVNSKMFSQTILLTVALKWYLSQQLMNLLYFYGAFLFFLHV